jgi:rod shape-determining protein MreC
MTPVTRSRLIILTLAAAGAVFFLHLLGALDAPEAWIMGKLSGTEARMAAAARSLRQALSAPFRVSAVMEENEGLRRDRDGLLAETVRLKIVEEENRVLRELLAFSERAKRSGVMARVLARTPEAGTHTILIDRGSDDGLRVDMPVVAGDGVLVGKIYRVDRASSLALLLTDTRSRVGASMLNAVRTQGIVQGERGLSLAMRLIPQNEEIAVGDTVVTSGIEPLIPRGLVIGRVEEVETRERNPFKQAAIVSPMDFDRLDIVSVLLP